MENKEPGDPPPLPYPNKKNKASETRVKKITYRDMSAARDQVASARRGGGVRAPDASQLAAL